MNNIREIKFGAIKLDAIKYLFILGVAAIAILLYKYVPSFNELTLISWNGLADLTESIWASWMVDAGYFKPDFSNTAP